MNITVKVTAAESPKHLKNHNLVLILPYPGAKKSECQKLTCKRFSPFQLALEQNPKLPSTVIDKPLALTTSNTSKILTENLAALHKSREAFDACENSQKIRRALSNNTRTSGDTKYVSGDSV